MVRNGKFRLIERGTANHDRTRIQPLTIQANYGLKLIYQDILNRNIYSFFFCHLFLCIQISSLKHRTSPSLQIRLSWFPPNHTNHIRRRIDSLKPKLVNLLLNGVTFPRAAPLPVFFQRSKEASPAENAKSVIHTQSESHFLAESSPSCYRQVLRIAAV